MNEEALRKAKFQQRLNQAAFALAVTALFSLTIFPVIMPAAVGSLALIFAEIAKGGRDQVLPAARKTVIMGSLAIGISIGLLIFTAITFVRVLHDPALQQEMSEVLYRMYGLTFEEFMQRLGWDLPLN